MNPLIIPFTYTREFSLILCQVWGGSYSNFLGVELKTHPRYISFIKKGMASTYRNKELDKEVNRLFLNKLQANFDYFQTFSEEHIARFRELKTLWDREYLSREELVYFVERLILFWPAIYSSTYVPHDDNFSDRDKEINLRLREKIDVAAHEASNIIVKTLQHIYPDLGDMVYAISLADFKNNSVDAKKVEAMYNSTLILVEDKLVDEEELEALKKQYNFELEKIDHKEEVAEIKGQAGYAGKVRGRVRLIFKRKEMDMIQEGEILVTGMTTPEFLPAMRKAAAFVTDEGGITCHAAIIARELKKPCIIGSKLATKILRDGDLVEVDANEGVVRILKRT